MFGWITLAIIILLLILIFYPGNLFRLAMWSVRRSAGLAVRGLRLVDIKLCTLKEALVHWCCCTVWSHKDNWNRRETLCVFIP